MSAAVGAGALCGDIVQYEDEEHGTEDRVLGGPVLNLHRPRERPTYVNLDSAVSEEWFDKKVNIFIKSHLFKFT